MGWKRVVGKLLLVAAGGGGLVVLVFVGLPWLTELLAPQGPPSPEEIVAEVLDVPGGYESSQEGVAEEVVTPVRPPLVGVRDNGEEVAVVFPAAGGEETQDEPPVVDDRLADEEQGEIQGSMVEVLPPVLSAEEVAAAMAGLESVAQDDAGGPVGAEQELATQADVRDQGDVEGALRGASLESSAVADTGRAGSVLGEEWRGEIAVVTDPDGARRVAVMLPPLSATRDVQELLEALGYAPGPLDGIWGERTDAAWRDFARDAGDLAARRELARSQAVHNAGPSGVESLTASGQTVEAGGGGAARDAEGRPSTVDGAEKAELARSQSVHTAEPSVTESPPPSGQTVEAGGDGAGQAGETRPAGLPPKPVVVPGTLRGVMGYRMPLVSRQGVPDQIVSGVLIPAHTTFVILKPGYWELVGLEPGEVERLRDGSAGRESAAEVVGREGTRVKRGWNLLRLFRRQSPSGQAGRPGEVKERRP